MGVDDVYSDGSEPFSEFLNDFLDSKSWTTVVTTVTFMALFQADVATMYYGRGSDAPLAVITMTIFLIFFFEMVLNLALSREYGAQKGWGKFTTFFGVLDMIATFSLIPDFVIIFGIEFDAVGGLIIARAARTARVGARLTRLMKLFRSSGGESRYSQLMGAGDDDAAAAKDSSASKIGEKVSDGLSKRVVFLVLLLLVVCPLFIIMPAPDGKIYSANMMTAVGQDAINVEWKENRGPMQYFATMEQADLVYFHWTGMNFPVVDWIDAESMRKAELMCYGWCPRDVKTTNREYAYMTTMDYSEVPKGCATGATGFEAGSDACKPAVNGKATVDYIKQPTQSGDEKAFMPAQIGTMIFSNREVRISEASTTITYMLFVMVVFGGGTTMFVNNIEVLVVNPIERMASALQNLSRTFAALSATSEDEEELEFLSGCIVKMVDLLKVSMGEAGTEIVQKNMTSESDQLDPMVPGRRVTGYYGFIDMRSFSVAMKCLQEDIMPYVNQLSHIIHTNVSKQLGSPNKNIGDAWLNVWIEKEERIFAQDDMTFADNALQSAVDTIFEVQSSASLKAMTDTPAFKEATDGVGYVSDIGFGFHYGWAIEGAVGSSMKVDATYLSPHVNMSARLEAASKQFGVDIMVSDQFYDHLGEERKRWMRRVDQVVLVGASKPMTLYAFDSGVDEGNKNLPKKNRFCYEFDLAVEKYIGGEWAEAKKLLFSCLAARPGEKQATFLLDFMETEKKGDGAPADWQGFRALNSK